jgi:hypothetical protein
MQKEPKTPTEGNNVRKEIPPRSTFESYIMNRNVIVICRIFVL